ncbi:MAG TPA: BTAD domain-containing putative transcriptional regulator [Gemmatimonadaceae bacterium]|nr:BTAD domain-containing putative transcriptional regulator [Gemmatimonadaceae bacterium]
MLRLVTFGGLSLESVNEAVLPRLSAQRLALLAVLAAEGEGDRHVSRERLTGLFWPDVDEERARHSLRQATYALRHDVGRDIIRSDFALSLDPSVITADVTEFRAALARGDRAAAATIVRGPFLAGFYVPAAAPFQRWVEEERARLHTAATNAIATLAADASASNDKDAAVGWWRQLTQLDPLSGRFAVGYLTALAERGDRAEALDFARSHAALVRRELETEPDPEIQRIEARLRSASVPSATPAPPPVAVPGPTAPQPAESPPASGSSVAADRPGRGHRLTRLAVAVAVVVIVGVAARTLLQSQPDAGASEATPTLAVGLIRDDGVDSVRIGGVLTDMLSTNLANVPGLRVIANSRVLALIPPGQDTSALAYAEAARRAGATELLEGRLLDRTADAFTIEMRRLDLKRGILRAAYRASAPTRFRLVDSVTAIVARTLELGGPSAPHADVTTRSVTAYRLYREGLRAYYRFDLALARQMMRAALEDDSTFAMAAYYDALLTDSPQSSAPSDRALRLAQQASERERLIITVDLLSYILGAPQALPMADTLAARYPDDARALAAVARARQFDGDWAGAARALQRAIVIDSAALGPTTPCYLCKDLAALADVYFWSDSLQSALGVARRYAALRPDWAPPWELVTWAAARLGDTAVARDALRKATLHSPEPRNPVLEVRIKILLDQYEDIEDRVKLLLESPKREDFLDARWWLLIALRNQGRYRDAQHLLTTGALRGVAPPQAPNVPDDVNEGILALERGDSRAGAAIFVRGWEQALGPGLSPGMAARYHAWRGTLAGMAIAAAGDTAALRRMADSVEHWGARSIYGRDRRMHHYLEGLLLSASGRDDDAIREFRDAIYSPTLGFTRVNLELGRALMRRNRAREAVAVVAPALRGEVDASNLYVTRTELHELLAQAYDLAGIRDSAAVHYRVVARSWSNADEAFHARRDAATTWLARYKLTTQTVSR